MSTTRPQLLHSFGAVGEGRKRKRSLPAVHSSGQTAAGLPVRAAGWCELPHEHRLPLSRLSIADISKEAVRRGLVASIGDTTLWRWLTEDAIRPWSHRSWIFPRAPHFKEKASRVLDLYEGRWKGRPLTTHDCVLSADEKTSIQARRRRHPPSALGRPGRHASSTSTSGSALGPISPPGTSAGRNFTVVASPSPTFRLSSVWWTK